MLLLLVVDVVVVVVAVVLNKYTGLSGLLPALPARGRSPYNQTAAHCNAVMEESVL